MFGSVDIIGSMLNSGVSSKISCSMIPVDAGMACAMDSVVYGCSKVAPAGCGVSVRGMIELSPSIFEKLDL